MPSSRRNFVIGVGSILTGSSAFVGSGAFSPNPQDRPESWVHVDSQTPSEGLGFSLGEGDRVGEPVAPDEPEEDENEEDDDSGPSGDGGATGGDFTESGTDDSDDESDEEEPETGGSDRVASLRLQASGADVLDSDYVLTDADGQLRGLNLEGTNLRARTVVGETSDGKYPNPAAGDRVAFHVINDGDVPVDLSVDIAGAVPDVLRFPSVVDGTATEPSRQVNLGSETVEELEPGQVAQAVVEVDTTNMEETRDDIVETVTFIGEPSV